MATNPRTWIYDLLDIVPGFLSTPARWIADRIFGVLDDGVEFAVWLKSGVDYLRSKGSYFADKVWMFSIDTYTTLRWLLDTRIPALIGSASDTLRKWATSTIATVEKAIRATVSTLDKWAKSAVATLIDSLTSVRDYLLGKVNGILDTLRKTVSVWYERLTDPRKFAAWVVGALVSALLGYLYSNRDKIAAWFLRTSPAFTAWLARELEAVLARLL